MYTELLLNSTSYGGLFQMSGGTLLHLDFLKSFGYCFMTGSDENNVALLPHMDMGR